MIKKNDGISKDDICQNQFTAYVVLAVKRKRQSYIKKSRNGGCKMTFMELLLSAKLGSTSAFEELFARYKNLLRKYSVVNGVFDEDLYQEQCVLFVRCIEIFDVNR